MNHIGVIGGGAWGTALAASAVRAGRHVTLWALVAERGLQGQSTTHHWMICDPIMLLGSEALGGEADVQDGTDVLEFC